MDNFDLKKFLIENKLTRSSKSAAGVDESRSIDDSASAEELTQILSQGIPWDFRVSGNYMKDSQTFLDMARKLAGFLRRNPEAEEEMKDAILATHPNMPRSPQDTMSGAFVSVPEFVALVKQYA